jgi:CheY-like chemotaxis protein
MNKHGKASKALPPLEAGSASKDRCVTVLHVDDDPNDTALLQAASRKAQAGFELHNACDGDEAMAYLAGSERFSDRTRYSVPALVLLDLKMPKANGFEILRWIRNHPTLSRLPVIVLSGSELQEDIKNAYAAGANSYLVKPLGFDQLVDLVRTINTVWLANFQSPGVIRPV